MKTGQHYRQVFIESEADLPKEDGEYFIQNKKFGLGSTHYWKINKARENTWLDQIDWYLLPVASDVTMPSDEDLESCYESFIRTNHLSREWEKHYELWHNGKSQISAQKREDVTDEDIENTITDMVLDEYDHNAISEHYDIIEQRVLGAKAMRDGKIQHKP